MRVVKLGGSLLDFPPLTAELTRWLSLQAPAATLIVVGGGALADTIREADRRQSLDPEQAHWLAIDAMSRNADWLAGRLPHATRVATIANAHALRKPAGLGILDANAFLRASEARPDRLPFDWSVTSDSLAARVAHVLGADELVLLKSRLPAQSGDLATAAEKCYVDAWFPRAAAGLPRVRCVNLRDPDVPEAVLRAAVIK